MLTFILGLFFIVGFTEARLEWEGSVEGICTDSCEQRGESYFWCHKPTHPFHRTGWDYCSPRPGLAANGCRCTSACDFGVATHRWCYTKDNCKDEFYNCGPVRDLFDPNERPIYVPVPVPVYIDRPVEPPPPPMADEEPY